MTSFVRPSEAMGFYKDVEDANDAIFRIKKRIEQLEEAAKRLADSMHDLAVAVRDVQKRVERLERLEQEEGE